MHNEKIRLYVKYLKRIAGITGAIFIFLIICNALNYIYNSGYKAGENWERILWHNFYEDKGKIENLYLGSSHVYLSLDPELLDDLSGQYNFNLSTSGQRLNGTYYLLREADRCNSLSHVYLELYHRVSVKTNSGTDPIDDFYRNWANTDYMKNSLNRLEYQLHITDMDRYAEIFFPFIRYRENLDDWSYIHETVAGKRDADYRAYEYREVDEDTGMVVEFRKQGYRYATGTVKDADLIYERAVMEQNPMGKTSERYLRKIIDYCQKKNIPITLYITPVPEVQFLCTEHYDYYINQVRDIAEEYQIPFYDFNLAKEEYLPIQQNQYFLDVGHMNADGANMFTSFFYEVVSGDTVDNEIYFYDSYEEKLQNTPPAVYGIYYWYPEITEEMPEPRKALRIASNREEGMEYSIIMTPGEGEPYTVQYFDENKEFTVPRDEHGFCTIVPQTTDASEDVKTMEVWY